MLTTRSSAVYRPLNISEIRLLNPERQYGIEALSANETIELNEKWPASHLCSWLESHKESSRNGARIADIGIKNETDHYPETEGSPDERQFLDVQKERPSKPGTYNMYVSSIPPDASPEKVVITYPILCNLRKSCCPDNRGHSSLAEWLDISKISLDDMESYLSCLEYVAHIGCAQSAFITLREAVPVIPSLLSKFIPNLNLEDYSYNGQKVYRIISSCGRKDVPMSSLYRHLYEQWLELRLCRTQGTHLPWGTPLIPDYAVDLELKLGAAHFGGYFCDTLNETDAQLPHKHVCTDDNLGRSIRKRDEFSPYDNISLCRLHNVLHCWELPECHEKYRKANAAIHADTVSAENLVPPKQDDIKIIQHYGIRDVDVGRIVTARHELGFG